MTPAGYRGLRDEVRRKGAAAVPGWQKDGADEFAPSAAEDAAELRVIGEMTDQQLKDAARAWRKSIESAAAAERAARVARGEPLSGLREAAQKLREQIAATKDRAHRARLTKLLASLDTPAPPVARARRYSRDELEATRGRLMDEASARHDEHLARRLRWQAAWALTRDEVVAGARRAVALLPDGRSLPLSAREWKVYWPELGEWRALVRHDGFAIPARVLIAEEPEPRASPGAASPPPRSAGECVSSRTPYTEEQVQKTVDEYLKREGIIDENLARTAKSRLLLAKQIVPAIQGLLAGCGRDHIIRAANRRQPAPGRGRPRNSRN